MKYIQHINKLQKHFYIRHIPIKKVRGYYNPNNDIIFIDKKELSNNKNYLEILLHEAAHAVGDKDHDDYYAIFRTKNYTLKDTKKFILEEEIVDKVVQKLIRKYNFNMNYEATKLYLKIIQNSYPSEAHIVPTLKRYLKSRRKYIQNEANKRFKALDNILLV